MPGATNDRARDYSATPEGNATSSARSAWTTDCGWRQWSRRASTHTSPGGRPASRRAAEVAAEPEVVLDPSTSRGRSRSSTRPAGQRHLPETGSNASDRRAFNCWTAASGSNGGTRFAPRTLCGTRPNCAAGRNLPFSPRLMPHPGQRPVRRPRRRAATRIAAAREAHRTPSRPGRTHADARRSPRRRTATATRSSYRFTHTRRQAWRIRTEWVTLSTRTRARTCQRSA